MNPGPTSSSPTEALKMRVAQDRPPTHVQWLILDRMHVQDWTIHQYSGYINLVDTTLTRGRRRILGKTLRKLIESGWIELFNTDYPRIYGITTEGRKIAKRAVPSG